MDFGQESLSFETLIWTSNGNSIKEYAWKHLVIYGQAMGIGYRIFKNERVCLETLGCLYGQVNGFWFWNL